MVTIKINDKLLSKNDQLALANHALFDRHGVWCLNLISAPGSGKTTLIERTVERLSDRLKIGALVGDLDTENDSRRIASHGVPVRQIITGGACHLNAKTIGEFLSHFDLEALDVMVIENVGNLVCPTSYYLGEHHRVSLISAPEGDDKPLKYPGAMHTSDALVINKIDLIPYTDFSLERARENALKIGSHLDIMPLSCKTGEGLEAWIEWFESHAREIKSRRESGTSE
ncbi:MAG TPA: hydrogenase nickel incorporation protein HypB [archaeon]|nr:hydrogenase nickel incorporation protein HypB [archaeon]